MIKCPYYHKERDRISVPSENVFMDEKLVLFNHVTYNNGRFFNESWNKLFDSAEEIEFKNSKSLSFP